MKFTGNNFIKIYRFVLIGVLLAGAGFAQQGGGVASITEHEISAHINYLASDLLEGREAGEKSETYAAAYIAAQFADAGLQPVGDDNSYFQNFQLTYSDLGEANFIELSSNNNGANITRFFQMNDDFFIFPFSASQKVVAPLAFAGYGITAPELGYDDYKNIDVRGKIVLVMRHEPQERDSTSVFDGRAFTKYAGFEEKAKTAQKHGAVGMLLVNDTGNHRDDRIPGWLKSWPKLSDEKMDIPCAWITSELANTILSGSGKTVDEWQMEIDRTVKPKSFIINNQTVTFQTQLTEKKVDVKNVVGLLKGETDETVVVGAHYDHEGRRDEDIYNGADDNASGTTGLLELAEAFGNGTKPQRSMLFIAFTAEEKGLIGSRYYVEHPLVPLKNTKAMVNLDMIGRNEDTASMSERARRGFRTVTAEESKNSLYVIGTSRSAGMKSVADNANKNYGLELLYDYDDAQGVIRRSDQYPFIEKGIPALFFSTGAHPDYHKPTDTADKIDIPKMTKVVQLVYETTNALANNADIPVLDEPLSTK